MNLLSPMLIRRKAAPYGGTAGGIAPGGAWAADRFGRDRAPSPQELVRENLGTAYACGTLNSGLLARSPLRLYLTTAKGEGRSRISKRGEARPVSAKAFDRLRAKAGSKVGDAAEVEEVTSHPAIDLLNRPVAKSENGVGMSRYTLLGTTQLALETVGRAYWWLEPGRAGPKSLWFLAPQYTTEQGSGDSRVIDRYWFSLGAGKSDYEPEEVAPFRTADLATGGYTGGMSPLRAAFDQVKLNRSVDGLLNARVQNGGMPSAMWTPKGDTEGGGIGPHEASRMRSAMRQALAQANAGGVMVAEFPGSLTPLSWPMNDVMDAARYELGITLICQTYHVPDTLVSPKSSNLANIQAARYLHAVNAGLPRMRSFEAALDQFYTTHWDDTGRLFWMFDDPEELKDPAQEIEKYRISVGMGSILINDDRKTHGLEEVPWGDQPYIGKDKVPLLPDGKPDPKYSGGGNPPPGAKPNDGKDAGAGDGTGLPGGVLPGDSAGGGPGDRDAADADGTEADRGKGFRGLVRRALRLGHRRPERDRQPPAVAETLADAGWGPGEAKAVAARQLGLCPEDDGPAAKAYSPEEDRDDDGKWTAGGGGAGKKPAPGKPAAKPPASRSPAARDKSPHAATPAEHAAARKQAKAKIAAAPVPTPEKVKKMRAALARAKVDDKARPGGDARGSNTDRKRRAKNLFTEFGGDEKGYVVCHGSGLKMHYTDDPALNPKGYPKFQQGKIFVGFQGGGYQMPNLLPESVAYNSGRNDAHLRPENSK